MDTLVDTEPAFIEEPSGWPTPRPSESVKAAIPPQTDGRGENMRKTSEDIGRTMDAIVSGAPAGKYGALDKLVGPESQRWPDTVCKPDCPHRRRAEQIAPPVGGPIITDVYPSVPERVYGLERDMAGLQRDFDRHRDESMRASGTYATKEGLHDLDITYSNAITAMDRRIDGVSSRMDRRVAWTVLQTAALIASSAYALILSYKHFIQ